MLSKRDDWTTQEVKKLIKDEFGPDFSEKHVRTILRDLGLKFTKAHTTIEDLQTQKNS